MSPSDREKISELEAQITQLEKEISRLKSKYEERRWCSVAIPPRCGHKRVI